MSGDLLEHDDLVSAERVGLEDVLEQLVAEIAEAVVAE